MQIVSDQCVFGTFLKNSSNVVSKQGTPVLSKSFSLALVVQSEVLERGKQGRQMGGREGFSGPVPFSTGT